MTLRRLLFAFLVMATPCGVSIAQEQSTSGPQFAPLESQVPAALASKKPSFSYYSVSGAVARPGVYEYDRESVTVGELAQKAGCLTEVEAAIVRPLTQEQVETQRKLPNVQLPPIPLLQSSRFVYLPEDKVFPGELVVFRPKNPSIQQTAHQVSSINPNGKVSLILANLIGRPIHALINPDQANVFSIASYLGISPDLVEKNAVIVLRSRQTQAGANSGQMMATEPLPSGTILLFDPSLVQLEKLNTESIEQLTQSQKPIRVASKPNEESRTDVPQSDLMTEFQESESVHASPVTSLNVPQFVNQPTPAPEEELNSVPVETAQAAPVVEMLEAPAEGSGMYDGGPNVIDVEGMLAGNENDLPTLEETPFPPMEAESDVMGLASADTVMQARNQASLWVISVLVVMIASVLGYYLFNTRSTTSAKAVKQKQKQKAIKPRAAVKRPNMLDNQDDPKVMEYRQKIEQKKKMFASALRREEDLQIDALINDFLPVKEEEMVITRTFNLPGIGQSFRIDPATTELQGPHFRQAAKVNRKSTETVTANVGTGKTESAGERPPAPTRSESSRPTGQPYHTIHKGGTKHFGSGR